MTRAVTIAELGDQSTFTIDGTNQRVGISSANPTVTLDVGGDANVSGTLTATSFSGDGTGLTGVASTDNIITSTASTFANINSTGIVTATKFVGDGSELTGVSGFATALSNDTTSILNSVFKTPKELTVGTGVSVTVESDAASGNIAFMRAGNIHVGSGSTFHVGSGTTLITNVLTIF
mgnify:CR=1 FL=1|tara:strand:- start:103 stop:636 length:534 start_codon:yes stop_codon:yes gene_type:complete